jgi:hypothetical protein
MTEATASTVEDCGEEKYRRAAHFLRTHQTDDQAIPPELFQAENPNAIGEKELDAQRHQRLENHTVEGSQMRIAEAPYITIARGKPVIDVCARERRLHDFDEKYTIYYIRTIRGGEVRVEE